MTRHSFHRVLIALSIWAMTMGLGGVASGVSPAVAVESQPSPVTAARSAEPAPAPTAASAVRDAIVGAARAQAGYKATPRGSNCNKFSAFWGSGSACGNGTRSVAWCADFAAWAWAQAGITGLYGNGINASASSFRTWGQATGRWHPIGDGYVPQPGDVAEYSDQHVGIYTGGPATSPTVINGNWWYPDAGAGQVHEQPNVKTNGAGAALSGYASAPAGSTPDGGITDGSFVRTPDEKVFRVAGGAPIYVTSWTPFGGPQPVRDISFDAFANLRPVPVDGTQLVAAGNGSVFVVAGGAPIVTRACSINGWQFCDHAIAVDPASLGSLDHLRPWPLDGTQIASAQNSSVWVFAGGAPIQTSACSLNGWNFCDRTVHVDQAAIDSLDHMRGVPVDGAQIASAQTSNVWVFAGGAPIQTASCTINGWTFCDQAVHVDQGAIDRLDHMRAVPADGTQIASAQNSSVWVFAGGAPIQTWSCSINGRTFCDHTVHVDQASIDRLDHMLAVPADGTQIASAQNSSVWVFAGGAPVQTHSCTIGVANFCDRTTHVDQNAVDRLDHMRATPRDGTVLRYLPSGRTVTYVGGVCASSSAAGAVDIDEQFAPCASPTPPSSLPTTPGAVRSLSATTNRRGSVTLVWSPPASSGLPITHYVVRSSTGLVRTVTGTRLVLRGLKAGRYSFTVSAASTGGVGPASPATKVKIKKHQHRPQRDVGSTSAF